MIASNVKDFENCSVSTADSIISSNTFDLVQGMHSEASVESVKERVHYFHSALHCLNKHLLSQSKTTMSLKEFIGKLRGIYQIPEFQAGILKGKTFAFVNNAFALKERINHSKLIFL